ncbi:MAG: ComEC family competence protein [Candidatus Omnitrophica bacterium]|nr:ComEC family competence protein [Candidatus Omnitrophota bacterium]
MRRPFFFLAIFISLVICAANFFISSIPYHQGHVSYFVSNTPRHFAVDGIVTSTPILKYTAFGDTYSFLVKPKLLKIGDKWFPAHGVISMTSYKDIELDYDEEIIFEAEIKAPWPGKKLEGYRAYLNRKGIFALGTIRKKDGLVSQGISGGLSLKRFAYSVKSALKERISETFSRNAGYFLNALLLGDRENISRRWKEIFANTQTIHLLAISGLHVGIISFIVLFILGAAGLPRGPKYITAIILVLFYAIMVGWMPSVARSTIMGAILMGSYVLKKNTDIYNSLGLAACLILIFQPNQLFDMGFILSFGAVLSLIYILPKINHALGIDRIDRKKKRGKFLYYFAVLFSGSLAVWLGLFPVILYSFNLISFVSLAVNILAIPCLFIIMSLSISALIFSGVLGALSGAFKESAEFFIAVLLRILDFSSKIPFAYFKSVPVSRTVIPLYYFILFMVLERDKLNRFLIHIYRKLRSIPNL